MDLVQSYETVLATRGREQGDLEFGFLSVPRRMIAESSIRFLDDPKAQSDWFKEMEVVAEPIPIGQTAGAIFSLLVEDDGLAARDLFMSGPEAVYQRATHEQELDRFAEYLAFAEVIPFEQSKLTNVSLTAVAVGSATAVAAKSIPAIAAAAVAPPVVFFVVAGLAGGVLVINGVGLIVGLTQKPRHQPARGRLRDRIHDRLVLGK
jgi:hypothetical protein